MTDTPVKKWEAEQHGNTFSIAEHCYPKFTRYRAGAVNIDGIISQPYQWFYSYRAARDYLWTSARMRRVSLTEKEK